MQEQPKIGDLVMIDDKAKPFNGKNGMVRGFVWQGPDLPPLLAIRLNHGVRTLNAQGRIVSKYDAVVQIEHITEPDEEDMSFDIRTCMCCGKTCTALHAPRIMMEIDGVAVCQNCVSRAYYDVEDAKIKIYTA